MIRQISPSVHTWSEIHGEARNEAYLWNSHLIQVKRENVLALVDPLPLSADEIRKIEEMGIPTHILITFNYHIRESESFRKRWGCRVLLPQEGLKDAEIPIDGTLQDGDLLWDMVEVIHVPDVHSFPEEVAYLVREEKGVLIVGDGVCGGRKDMGIPDGEISIPIPFAKYIADIEKSRSSLRKLLAYSFEKMCFAHGTPVLQSPKPIFRRFLENDEIWESLRKRKAEDTA